MDAERFDAAVKAFGAAAHRRRVVHGLLGGVLGGLPAQAARVDDLQAA